MTTPRRDSGSRVRGMTLQVYVPSDSVATARAFYTSLFEKPPQFEPHDDFLEWAPIAGQECWFQLAGRPEPRPMSNRVRFLVPDVRGAVAHLDRLGIGHTEPTTLPDVVTFLDFSDPWDNCLGFYEDLLPSGQQATYPGTSVGDESLFRPAQ